MNSTKNYIISSLTIHKPLTQCLDKIIKCLNNKGVPSKLMKLISKTLQDTKARVKINQTLTEKFEISTGVKQGDPLSATLLSIVIDDIINS